MIQMEYGQLTALRNNNVLVQKVANTPLRAQLSYQINKIFKDLEKMSEAVSKEWNALNEDLKDKHCEKDADGKPVENKDEKGNVVGFKLKKDAIPEYQKAHDDFSKRVCTIDRTAIAFQEIVESGLQLSAVEIELMEPLFTEASVSDATPESKPDKKVTKLKKRG